MSALANDPAFQAAIVGQEDVLNKLLAFVSVDNFDPSAMSNLLPSCITCSLMGRVILEHRGWMQQVKLSVVVTTMCLPLIDLGPKS